MPLLLILEVWLALAVTVCVLGVAVERFLARGSGDGGEELDGGIVALLGLAALTTIAGLLSLALPMNGVGVAAVAAIVAATGWMRRQDLRGRCASMRAAILSRSRFDLLLALLVVVGAMVWACVPTPLYDDGAYHAQAIRWAEQLPAVPGLANLQYRLAWVPTWFVASALTSGSFAGERVIALNSFLFLCVALYLWNGLARLGRSPASVGAWFRALALPGALLIANESLSHATPDLPVAMLWLVLLGLAIEEIEDPSRPQAALAALALGTLALFAISLRLSALPALFLVGWIAVRRPGSFGRLIGLGAVLAAPCLLRNTVQSGYPLFPLSWPSLRWLDWTVPAEIVDQAQRDVRAVAWAVARGGLPWPDRIALGIVPLAALLSWRPFATLARFRSLWIGGLLALLFWLATAPDPRFARGLYLPLALLAGICGGLGLGWASARRRSLAQAGVFLVLALDLGRAVRGLPAGIWLRAAPPPRFDSVTKRIGELAIHGTTREAGCWYEPFPCTDWILPIAARGTSLGQGFRPTPPP